MHTKPQTQNPQTSNTVPSGVSPHPKTLQESVLEKTVVMNGSKVSMRCEAGQWINYAVTPY